MKRKKNDMKDYLRNNYLKNNIFRNYREQVMSDGSNWMC